MEKSTLKKIIRAVRQLEIEKSVNDSQFEFCNKKRRRIERKMSEKASNSKKYESYYQSIIAKLINNNYCYLWQSETDTLTMLNRKTGDKIEFKIL